MTPLDVKALFIRHQSKTKFASLEEEFSAIKRGLKKMSFWEFDKECSDSDIEAYEEISSAAYAAGLASVQIPVVHERRAFRLERFALFVLEHHELWRIPAMQLLMKAAEARAWSDAAEAYRSMLLGYPDDDVQDWMSLIRNTQVCWGMHTIYAVLSSVAFEMVIRSGMRLFPNDGLDGCFIIWSAEMAPDVGSYGRIGERYLCRAALSYIDISAVFTTDTSRGNEFQVAELDRVTSEKINRSLKSNIQVQAANGWLNEWDPK